MKYLITGGTGTFGKAFMKRLLSTDGVEEIRLFSRDEAKQWEMKQTVKDSRVRYFIGDVRNKASLRDAIMGVDVVFHAAAMKHVWSCEQFPEEAFRTNVDGTLNVIDMAIVYRVGKFILLSSDKAVFPTGVMGMTKALAEKAMIAKSRNSLNTTLCAVRFGNLIDSRGNVVEVWNGQRFRNEPLTVTEPSATRFFMTTEQAMDTVSHAVMIGENGEIMLPECKAASMMDLHEAYKSMWQYDKVSFTGMGDGEKLHEWLDEETCSRQAKKFLKSELMEMMI